MQLTKPNKVFKSNVRRVHVRLKDQGGGDGDYGFTVYHVEAVRLLKLFKDTVRRLSDEES